MPMSSRPDPFGGIRRGERIGLSDALDAATFDDDADERREEQAGDDGAAASGSPDFYARLGVSATVTHDDLRRAYHRLVKLWHPDRYTRAPDALRARAERRMRQLNEAYAVLSDPQARATYDEQRQGPTGGQSAPMGDVINVFGQRTAAHAAWPVDDLEGHASANPNGAGQFFGMLAVILALALLGGAIGGAGFGGGVGALVILLGIAGLLVAAGFMVTDSPLAKWAFAAMESDPGGAARAGRRARPAPPPPDANEFGDSGSGEADEPADASAGAHVDAATFDALIAEALTGVPHTFDRYLRNVIVRAEQEPDAETLSRAGVPEGHTLLGLYTGVSLTRRGAGDAGPEVITIYRGPIERHCGGDLARIRRQVRATVLHELAHHFGIDHDEMPEWVK